MTSLPQFHELDTRSGSPRPVEADINAPSQSPEIYLELRAEVRIPEARGKLTHPAVSNPLWQVMAITSRNYLNLSRRLTGWRIGVANVCCLVLPRCIHLTLHIYLDLSVRLRITV